MLQVSSPFVWVMLIPRGILHTLQLRGGDDSTTELEDHLLCPPHIFLHLQEWRQFCALPSGSQQKNPTQTRAVTPNISLLPPSRRGVPGGGTLGQAALKAPRSPSSLGFPEPLAFSARCPHPGQGQISQRAVTHLHYKGSWLSPPGRAPPRPPQPTTGERCANTGSPQAR